MLKLREIFRGIRLRLTTYSATVHDVEGAVYLQDDTGNRLKTYIAGTKREILTNDQSQTLTNKTLDIDNNTLSNVETDNFKIGVIDTDVALTANSDTKIATQKATKAYTDTVQTNLTNHITNTSNPHSVTKTQVGLSNVDNIQQLPLSYLDTDTALTANSDIRVASQKATKAYADTVSGGVSTALNNHITNTLNPHSVTKTQVGLSNVDNIQQLPLSYLDTDTALTANSDSKVASQKATKAYVDAHKNDLSAHGIISGTLSLLASQSGTNLIDLSTTKAVRILGYVVVDSTYETFDILTVKRAADYKITTVSVGDITGISFAITAGGFLTYSSGLLTTASIKYNIQTIV